MEFLGQIFIEISKCIGPRFCKYIEYHRKLEKYKKNLIKILDDLEDQKNQIKVRLEAECGSGKLTKTEVDKWLKNVQKIIDEAKNIEDTFKEVKCFSRVLRAELVDKKIQEAREYFEKGTSFNSLVIDAPPPIGITLPTTRLVGETTAKKNMEEIWGHLMGNEIQKIGVCGMFGAGKTTIVTHINNRLVEENKFNQVIWVTVSQTLDLTKVQNGIANALKQNLSEKEDKKVRTGTLLSMLKGKKFVLILDDMWEAIRLEEIGIPEPTEENGCKLVITTRSLEVCRFMDCKTVQLKPLLEKEALELFFEKAKLDIFKVRTLKKTVELIVKQCAGLPLAIVKIASSLKGEEDTYEWNTALHEMLNDVRSIKVNDGEVFIQLKFSYDRLNDERIQRCFLYCALYPKDHNIPKNELVDCWIAEGLVEEMANLKATEDRAHSIIKRLVSNCLLLESIDWKGGSYVKLHDVVRDMTLKYITSKSPLFMVKAGMKLEKLPSGKEWKENLDSVSLMNNHIKEIPSSMSPNCQILSTLLFQHNPLQSIPESFFSHMHGLKILNLSGTEIESLPNSISELTNLTALLLQNCYQLKEVPSLARLGALEKLELGFTKINEVPVGMEMLANLRSLDLFSMDLYMIPAGIFPKLFHLRKLRIHWGLETLRVTVEEAAGLKDLDCFVVQFCNLQDFNCYTKSLNGQRVPNKYHLFVNQFGRQNQYLKLLVDWTLPYDVNKVVILEGCKICGREEDSIVLPKEVEFLLISDCNIPMGTLFNMSESSPAGQYSHFKFVSIYGCEKLEKLISSKLLSELKNLERIDLNSCSEMEELIAVDDDDDNEERSPKSICRFNGVMVCDSREMEKPIAIDDSLKKFLLPKLKRLSLSRMPKLKSICSCLGLVMVCDSLQFIDLWECPKLKKILSSSSKLQLGVLKNLEEIQVVDCGEMEEIIAIDNIDCKKELIISLPKLRKLTLRGMPKLKSIINICGSTNGVMVCDSLQEINIWDCPELKCLPIYVGVDEKGQPSPPSAFTRIIVKREWWDALKWDHLHPRAKTLLLPSCRF